MREQMEKFIPKVYSHNDFHIKNMVYDAENGKIDEQHNNMHGTLEIVRKVILIEYYDIQDMYISKT